MQQKSLARFAFGQSFYKDILENKSGQDNVPTCGVQAGLNPEICVDISASVL